MSFDDELVIKEELKNLEEILIKGIETKNHYVKSFLQKEVYPIYLNKIEETFGIYEENPEIKGFYSN